jgi:hypothetical protein
VTVVVSMVSRLSESGHGRLKRSSEQVRPERDSWRFRFRSQ